MAIARYVVSVPLANGKFVSSSELRDWLAEGRVADANAMLTQPYRIRGRVEHGAARGAALGFPTANLKQIDTLLPAQGVYAGAAWLGDERKLAAINIGPQPTFGAANPTVEAHLLDFDGDLYNRTIQVELTHRLRDIVSFNGVDELRTQLQSDVAAVRELN